MKLKHSFTWKRRNSIWCKIWLKWNLIRCFSFYSFLYLKLLSFKGETDEEIYLALAISVLEGLPQLLKMAMVQTHWHSDFESVSLDLFSTSVNVPLSVWYLKFYCNPRIKAYLTNYLKSNWILWYKNKLQGVSKNAS